MPIDQDALNSTLDSIPDPRRIVTQAAGGNPDKDAEAVNLSRATGVPAPVIGQDVDAFKGKVNLIAATHIVNNNPSLYDYVQSDPMHARVSADDWDALDNYTRSLAPVRQKTMWDRAINATKNTLGGPALSAASEAFQHEMDFEGLTKEGKELVGKYDNPLWKVWATGASAAGVDINAGLRLPGAIASAIGAGYGQLYFNNPEGGKKFMDDVNTMMQLADPAMGGMPHVPEELNLAATRAREALARGERPARGVDPILDAVHKTESGQQVDNIKESFRAAQKSATKDRVADFFKEITRDGLGDRTIGISPEAIRELYGEAEPKVGDDKLGFIPDVEHQWELSKETGADIQVPLSDLIYHMDPKSFDVVADGIRPYEEGFTNAEQPSGVVADAKYPSDPYPTQAYGMHNIRTANTHAGAMMRGTFDVPSWHGPVQSVIDELATQLGLPITPRVWVGDGGQVLGYTSQRGHIMLSSALDQYRAMNVALHEFGHQVDFQKVQRADAATKSAINAAWLKDHARIQKEDPTLSQIRPLSWGTDDNTLLSQTSRAQRNYILDYKEWFADQARTWLTKAGEPKGLVEKFFKGIADHWKAIYAKMAGHVDVVPTIDEFMRGIYKGEQTSGGPAVDPVQLSAIRQQIAGGPEEIRVFHDPKAIGMTKDHWRRYMGKLNEHFQRVYNANLKRAEKAEKLRQGLEWRQNRNKMMSDVIDEFAEDPKFIADRELRDRTSGVKLDSAALTDEQRARLPRNYHSASGFHPDDVAQFYGYTSGEEMLNDLMRLHEDRGKIPPGDYITRLIEDETDRRMEARYGNLEENIREAAAQQTTGPTMLDAMHAELEALMGDEGKAMPFTREQIESKAREVILNMQVQGIKASEWLAAMTRVDRQIESALLKGDHLAAFKLRQSRYIAAVSAKIAGEIGKAVGENKKIADRYNNASVKDIPRHPEWVDPIQFVLSHLGFRTGRIEENMLYSLRQNGFTGVEDFFNAKTQDGAEAFVPQWWDERTRTTPGELTGQQALDLNRFLKSADAWARKLRNDTQQYMVDGKLISRDDVLARFSDQVTSLGPAKELGPSRRQRMRAPFKLANRARWEHMIIETVLDRFDRWDPQGLMNQLLVQPMSDGAYALEELSKQSRDTITELWSRLGDTNKKIVNTLWRDKNGALLDLNRGHLYKILANVGNASNRARLFGGYGIDEAAGMRWLWDQLGRDRLGHADAIKWAQDLGKFLDGLHEKADHMSRLENEVGIDKLPIDGVEGPNGQHIDGWYHPVDYDSTFDQALLRRTARAMFKDGYYRATTAQGHWRGRVEDFKGAPIDLSLNSLPGVVRQMVFDITMRPAINRMRDFFYNDKFQELIKTHYSEDFADILIPTLENLANTPNLTRDMRAAEQVMGWLTKNTVRTMIGYSVKTVFKHGLTAAARNFLTKPIGFTKELVMLGMPSVFGVENGVVHAWRNSDECRNRLHGYSDLFNRLYGIDADTPSNWYNNVWNHIKSGAAWSSTAAIGLFDLMSSMAYFNAVYKEERFINGRSEGVAKYIANKAVRQTHGSSIITNKPLITQNPNPVLRSFSTFYTLFNENLQNIHKAGAQLVDTSQVYQKAGLGAALSHTMKASYGAFLSLLLPGFVDEVVEGVTSGKWEDSYAMMLGKSLLGTVGGAFLYSRDIINALLHGFTPSGGIIGTMSRNISEPIRDLITHKHWNTHNKGVFIRDLITAGGTFGVPGATAPVGRAAQFGYGVLHGTEHPRDIGQWARGLTRGTVRERRAR